MQVQTIRLANSISIQIFEHISAIDEQVWNSITTNIFFYQTHQFLSVIEEIHSTIQFRYVLVYKEDKIVAGLYTQLLDFSFRNLVNYNANASTGIKSKVKQYIAKKDTKLLNLGNVFFTGDKGIICQQDDNIISLLPDIFTKLYASFTKQKPRAYLVANIYLQDESKCASFSSHAFHPFITEPDMLMPIAAAWTSFDDYLSAISSKYRVRDKKILALSSSIKTVNFTLEEIKNNRVHFSHLFANVINHVAFNMATLSVDFFERMKLLYVDKFNIIGYYKEEALVGFACLFNVDENMLHVHYIGLDYTINKEQKLYNRMLLDFVKFAIENKKNKIHFGRTATEIKSTIGAQAFPLNAYLKMHNPMLNISLPYFLSRIKPAEYTLRNPFRELS